MKGDEGEEPPHSNSNSKAIEGWNKLEGCSDDEIMKTVVIISVVGDPRYRRYQTVVALLSVTDSCNPSSYVEFKGREETCLN